MVELMLNFAYNPSSLSLEFLIGSRTDPYVRAVLFLDAYDVADKYGFPELEQALVEAVHVDLELYLDRLGEEQPPLATGFGAIVKQIYELVSHRIERLHPLVRTLIHVVDDDLDMRPIKNFHGKLHPVLAAAAEATPEFGRDVFLHLTTYSMPYTSTVPNNDRHITRLEISIQVQCPGCTGV